jgi:ferritin-like metal-binding protein YciE
MADPNAHLLDWLRDAHAMEQQAEQMLKAQAGRLEHYPELKARIEQHLQETLGQQKLVASCIERLGGGNSALKDVAGKVMAFGQAMGGMMMTDEVIKGAMASFAFENLEIATYTTLIARPKMLATWKRSESANRSCRKNKLWPSGCWSIFLLLRNDTCGETKQIKRRDDELRGINPFGQSSRRPEDLPEEIDSTLGCRDGRREV